MRSPESRPGHRPGRTFEEELNLRYLSPGAFTVLSSDVTGAPPDPPRAPQPYRVSPSVKRHRNQAFSILAEPTAVRSRSPSPSSGRVSPFRGRGFNPAGSRLASPVPPSPPEDTRRFKSTNADKTQQRKSLIPQLQRRGSAVLSSEDGDSSPRFRRKSTTALRPQLSKSLNHIGPQNVANKPPPNPRRPGGVPPSKNPLFSRLSPIAGSSPEPSSDKSTSSPSRIPMSRSTPPSRRPSPSREFSPGRSRPASRNGSRDSSPSVTSPTRIPLRNKRMTSPDKAVKAPTTKTQEIRNRMEQNKNRTSVSRRGSVGNRSVTNGTGKVSVGSVGNRSNKSSVSSTSTAKGGGKTAGKVATKAGKSETTAGTSDAKPKPGSKASATKGGEDASRPTAKPRLTLKTLATSKATFSAATKLAGGSATGGRPGSRPGSKPGSKPGSLHGSPARKPSGIEAAMQRIGSSGKLNETATTVVTTTTSTVTTPLKIDAKIEELPAPSEPTPKETPMYLDEEGRVLSATSVSNAMERMNDTVLDSQTLLKDHNMTKLSPATAAVVSLSGDGGGNNKDNKAVPSVETVKTETSQSVHSSVVVGNGGGNNLEKLITPDDSFGAKVNNVSANERIREARTMVASDVKPIKIMVREKASDEEVQSGNVRFPTNATNGVSSTLGAPPLPPENGNQPPEEEQPKKSRCRTLMEKMPCCKAKSSPKLEEAEKKSCFDFLRRKKKVEVEQIIVSSPEEAEEAKKRSLMDRLNCCKGNKVGDSGGWCRRKKDVETVNRRDSILSEPLTKRQKCKNFFKTLFCCGSSCCQRKQSQSTVEDSRRESMLSKKKSLTPTVLPPEEPKNKLDTSLVEYTSTMKAAIPILPVYLAYFCCFFNVFAPGTGTVFSGLFCLCMGIPRFSQKDGPKPRVGSFIINTIIGCGQCFTVLFCLVGWGWSIWWGVIMIKVAKKYRKLKKIELAQEAHEARERAAAAAKSTAGPKATPNRKKDVEKGRP